MFLTFEVIIESLNQLKIIHPFYGMTFLVCKLNKFPVGRMNHFSINNLETEFLSKFFKPNKKSGRFYQVFKTPKQDRWLNSDYASSGSQSTRTRGDLSGAFLHEKDTDLWGWSQNYVDILERHLGIRVKIQIPAFYLAVWLYRERNFQSETTAKDIINLFVKEFNLTVEDKKLFDLSMPELNFPLLRKTVVTWDELKEVIPLPPDVEPEESGALTYLEIADVGPSRKLVFEPADRLNLIAGDNGLGKSFLLDCAWWALTGDWAGVPAYPREEAKKPQISFEIAGEAKTNQKVTISYDWDKYGEDKWTRPSKRPILPGLCIYVRVDGSFAVFDPARRENHTDLPFNTFNFRKEDVRDGRGKQINGLIADWVRWQYSPDKSAFNILTKVLKRLSPPAVSDLGELKPGKPIRLAGDSREIPTIEHPYGVVPIVHASAGVQRIITLAYLLVWAWREHKINSDNIRKRPEQRVVILIDEIESHLHPQWQRSILPALLEIGNDLSEKLSVQLLIATHSPLVIGSAAPHFDYGTDKLFQIDLVSTKLFGKEAEIQEVDYVNYGRVGSWLMTKDVFEFRQDQTSLDAERAIVEAQKLQQEEHPSKEQIKATSRKLFKYLSDLDVFLPHWIAFAAKHGVEL